MIHVSHTIGELFPPIPRSVPYSKRKLLLSLIVGTALRLYSIRIYNDLMSVFLQLAPSPPAVAAVDTAVQCVQ